MSHLIMMTDTSKSLDELTVKKRELPRTNIQLDANTVRGRLSHAKSADEILARQRRNPVRVKRFYTTELDMDFFKASFDSYVVSRTVKKKGGGDTGPDAECGGLRLGLRDCFWINKQVYEGTGSSKRLDEKHLLYLGSRDGFFNASFHRAVDLKGPTLTVVLLANGRMFGGFSSLSWRSSSRGQFYEDPLAFLFVLSDGLSKKPPDKLSQRSTSSHAVFHDPDLGPCFGRALALQLDVLALSSSDVSPSSYRVPPGASLPFSLAGTKSGWDVKEVAVWRV